MCCWVSRLLTTVITREPDTAVKQGQRYGNIMYTQIVYVYPSIIMITYLGAYLPTCILPTLCNKLSN